MKASLIIPTLNEEKYLGETLLLLKNQSERDFEVIVADFHSKDRTLTIAEAMGARIVRARKRGPGAGRNAGAEVAKGDILIFIDADTWVPSDFVEKVVRYFRDTGAVAGTCRYTCNDGNTTDRFLYIFASNGLYLLQKFRIFTHLPGFCSFYYRPVFEALGGYREDLTHQEDGELAQRFTRAGRLGYVPNLTVATSARRVRKWGYFKITMSYLADATVFFFAKKIIGLYDLGAY